MPSLVSLLAILLTLLATVLVLLWNYSETQQRRLTKQQNVILDHWGKLGPMLNKEDLQLIDGGELYYGETSLRFVLIKKIDNSSFSA